jgi:uncharacterized protein
MKSTNWKNEEMIGIISDTHGLLRAEALKALRKSSRIIHAGDIGNPEILTALEAIAPVVAVRGNNDREAWAESIPVTQTITVLKRKIFVIHNLKELEIDPAAAQISVVISGHSHQPKIEWRNGVLFLNPGSAGPRRFRLAIAVAHLHVSEKSVRARILTLD